MFFDKILDFFKIENLFKDDPFLNLIKEQEPDTGFATNQYDSEEYNHIYNIYSYWTHHTYNYEYSQFNYRESTLSEKQNFATIKTLSAFSKKARTPDIFSELILNEFEITNWNSFFNKLLKKGYLQKPNIFEFLDAEYKVPELKIIADRIGIKKTGKKNELIKRVVNSLSDQQIDEIIRKSNYYILSQKGHDFLCGKEDYIEFYRHRHTISLAEFNDNRIPTGGKHKRNFYDTMFQALSNRKFYFEYNNHFEHAGLVSYNIYSLLIEEYKNTDHNVPLSVALTNYVEYLYDRLCFPNSIYTYTHIDINCSSVEGFIIQTPDKDISIISDQEPYINYEMIFANKPPCFLTYTEFKQYIHELFTSPIFDKEKWNTILQNRARKIFIDKIYLH